MNDVIIREARPEDAARLIAHLKRIGGESDDLTFGGEGLPVTVEQEEAHIRRTQTDPHSVLYVAICGGEIIGDGSLSGPPRRMSHRAEPGIAVVKAHWGQGIGGRLMEHLIAYARCSGLEFLDLKVRTDDPAAIHLYERFGFQKYGVIPAF